MQLIGVVICPAAKAQCAFMPHPNSHRFSVAPRLLIKISYTNPAHPYKLHFTRIPLFGVILAPQYFLFTMIMENKWAEYILSAAKKVA